MNVEKWVIRKRFTFMWGSPGTYWRVSHSSIPDGHPLHGSMHLYSFEDALEYVLAKIAEEAVA
jgi:hypothetical protein